MSGEVKSVFPDPATADENGIVAFSRGITCGLLQDAYRHGIFPWPFGEGRAIPWCAPRMRGVLMLEEFHVPSSFVREMRKLDFTCRVDTCFGEVIRACASAVRPEGPGTWITEEVIRTYCEFHRLGYAHSFETFDASGSLAGGLYGVAVGRIFCGESMFYRVSGASKFAFVRLAAFLRERGAVLIDTQMVTNLTGAFGAREIPSARYMELLARYGGGPSVLFPPR